MDFSYNWTTLNDKLATSAYRTGSQQIRWWTGERNLCSRLTTTTGPEGGTRQGQRVSRGFETLYNKMVALALNVYEPRDN